MSQTFRAFIQKVGSGPHTSKDLTREEAAIAMGMMLLEEATPAQIGAFLIAHRIKRPVGDELAGMLDTYDELGPHLTYGGKAPVTVLGTPYDGRSRTAPLTPLTALILATVHRPVVMHGAGRVPTKYGLPLVDIWQHLGVDWTALSLETISSILTSVNLGFVYTPQHFALTNALIEYRDQIGKRPPLAMLELMWAPVNASQLQIVSGYVHPPTENFFRETFARRGQQQFVTVKGLEGSCDLPRDRTCIIGIHTPNTPSNADLDRILLHPRDYGFAGTDVPLADTPEFISQIQAVLRGEASELQRSAIWNGGFYLWQAGVCSSIEAGLAHAEDLLMTQQVAATLEKLQVEVRRAINVQTGRVQLETSL
ncbi:MAG: anthranilate phosphoribosyltransferase family protein [Synechococcales cyanobacterium T60_A2020_003]|nr:anthranilate phosphoribosyltransferase family protein [Synechococcales cyanobacterium T60_A2020_003]